MPDTSTQSQLLQRSTRRHKFRKTAKKRWPHNPKAAVAESAVRFYRHESHGSSRGLDEPNARHLACFTFGPVGWSDGDL